MSILALVCVLAAPGASFGQTVWTNGTGNSNWFTPGNWSLGVPNNPGDAIIGNGGTAQLQAPGGSVRRLRVGVAGGTGNLVVDGGTLVVTDDLHLNEGSAGPASMIVRNGSTVTALDTVVGFNSAANTSFLISGAGTVYNATNDFTVGSTGAGVASLTVDSGAVLASGTSSIAPTSINGAAGSNATVTGAGSRWSTTGAFTVGSGVTGVLNIENQGTVHVGTALSIGATSNINLNGGTLRFNTASHDRINYTAGTIRLAGNRTISIASNGDAAISWLFGSTVSSNKILHVEGTALIFDADTTTFTIDGGSMISSEFRDLDGMFLITNGGTVNTTNNAAIGTQFSGDVHPKTTVNGLGSSWTANNINVGGDPSLGTLTIQAQALVHVENALTINSLGTVNLNGGTLRFNTVSGLNRLTYSSGTIQLAGARNIGTDTTIQTLFGAVAPVIPTGKALTVEGTATLSKPLTINGGTFATNGLEIDTGGALQFDRGVLEITGGTISGLPNLIVPANGELRAQGVHSVRFTGLTGSTVTPTGNLSLGNNQFNGFYNNGTLFVREHTLTLVDSNDAVLDSGTWVKLGSGDPGTLVAANGLTLNFGGNITGEGTVDTPNNPAKPFINNGNIVGMANFRRVTLAGYVKGVGNYDNVDFTGTFAPGFSPATVNLGSAAYSGTLQIEIGGLAPGSGHDQLNHILGNGIADLGGTLEVALLPSFVPQENNSFTILTAMGGIVGTFADRVLPNLGGGLSWNVVYNTNSVVLEVLAAAGLPGDYNNDGIVNAADYTVWRDNLGSGTSLPNDDTAGVGPDDYDRWKLHYGNTSPGSGANEAAAVPEPAPLVLLALGGLFAVFVFVRHNEPRLAVRRTRVALTV